MLFVFKSVRFALWSLCIISIVKMGDSTGIKIIDEPFSIHHSGTQSHNVAPMEKEIILKREPKRLSGPPHFFELEGKCYTLHKGSYKYEFCPFHNVTQREQTYRWNAFHGALGAWKEWEIVGDKFTSMLMESGESCIGPLTREVKVFLQCGSEEKFIDIEEPITCSYNLTFETPLACAEDVFLVYPVLSNDGKVKWETLEEGLRENELTVQGYEKKRRELFIQEGLKINELEELEKSKESNLDDILKRYSGGKHSIGDYRLFSRSECIQKYGDLLKEVDRLRQLLKTVKNDTTPALQGKHEDAKTKTEDDGEHKKSALPLDLIAKQNQNQTEATNTDYEKEGTVKGLGLHHSRDLRKGRKGDDGANIKAKLQENSVLKSLGLLMGGKDTARKLVNLSNEEQKQRGKELAEEHMKTHRVH